MKGGRDGRTDGGREGRDGRTEGRGGGEGRTCSCTVYQAISQQILTPPPPPITWFHVAYPLLSRFRCGRWEGSGGDG